MALSRSMQVGQRASFRSFYGWVIFCCVCTRQRKTNIIWYCLYMESKDVVQDRNRVTDVKKKRLWLPRAEEGVEMNWEMGTDRYRVLSIKQITDKDLLYSTGNAAQCSAMTHVGKESENTVDMCTSSCFTFLCLGNCHSVLNPSRSCLPSDVPGRPGGAVRGSQSRTRLGHSTVDSQHSRYRAGCAVPCAVP